MGLVVTGDVLGDERRSGTLDDGKPWNVHELSVLDGMTITKVRLEKLQDGTPGRGEFVALECDQRFGKLHALRRLPEVEAALTGQ